MSKGTGKHIEGSGGKQVPRVSKEEQRKRPGSADEVLTDAPIQQDDVERKTRGRGPELPAVHEGRIEQGWPIPAPVNPPGQPEGGGLNEPRRR